MEFNWQNNSATSLRATKEQLTCDLDGEAVVLNLKTGVYISLNPMAAAIWDKLQNPIIASALRDVIVAEYEVQPEVCSKDLEGVVNELLAHGLIEADPVCA